VARGFVHRRASSARPCATRQFLLEIFLAWPSSAISFGKVSSLVRSRRCARLFHRRLGLLHQNDFLILNLVDVGLANSPISCASALYSSFLARCNCWFAYFSSVFFGFDFEFSRLRSDRSVHADFFAASSCVCVELGAIADVSRSGADLGEFLL